MKSQQSANQSSQKLSQSDKQKQVNDQPNFESIKEQIDKELGYGSDLYYDEKDEQELQEKEELAREKIMEARFQRRQQLLERYELVKAQRAILSKQSVLMNPQTGKKDMAKRNSNKRNPRCSDCDKKEEHKHAKRRRQSSRGRSSSSSSSSSSGSSSDSSGSSSSSSQQSHKKLTNSQGKAQPRIQQQQIKDEQDSAALKDAKPIILTRNQLLSFLDEPYFDQIIIGALARVAYDNKYRVCKIKSAYETNAEYSIETQPSVARFKVPGQHQAQNLAYTKKELVCIYGANEKKFKLTLVSNQEPTYDEFFAYQQSRVTTGKKLLTKSYCERKLRNINQLKNVQLRSEDIVKKVKEKLFIKILKGDLRGLNIPLERRKLQTEIDQMKEMLLSFSNLRNNDREVQDLKKQIKSEEEVLYKMEQVIKEQRMKEELQLKKELLKNEGDTDMNDETNGGEFGEREDVREMRQQVLKLKEREERHNQKLQKLMKLNYAQRIQTTAQELVDNVSHIRLGIDLKLQQENFGGFFQKPLQVDLENYKFCSHRYLQSLNQQQQDSKMKIENLDPRVTIIKFEDYFAN